MLAECMKQALTKALALALLSTGRSVALSQQPAPEVAFTFDDLPAHGPLPPGMARPEPVREILAALKAEQMPPTYGFVNGFRLVKWPYQRHILQAWVRSGNPVGNHTWSHPELDKTSAQKYEADIARDEPTLRQVAPHGDWHWFRYPYLEEGETLAKREAVRGWLLRYHYRIAEVNIDFEDYMWNDTYGRCADQHNSAAVQSLHDSYLATADEYITYSRSLSHSLYGRDIPYVLLLHVGAFDAKMLPELIALYRKRGFQFVTLPQAEADPVYSTDPAIAYSGGGLMMELQAAKRNVVLPTGASEPEAELDKMCR